MTTDSDGVTVVLGWDGLDPELLETFGVAESFGTHRTTIDTITNPVLETPHTRELWPTLITGLPPSGHGMRVGNRGESLDWDNPLIDMAADVASYVLPHRVRARVGRHLRNAGADLTDTMPETYADRGIDTVFDERVSCALALPNYWTERSAALGLTSSRKATFRAFMRVGDSGGMELRDDAALDGVEQRIWAAAGKKLGTTRAAIARDYDLVWVWLGFLDTVGHIAPAVDAGGLQARAYRQAATWTDHLRRALAPQDTLVCVSDHGLQDGDHTEVAALCADDPAVLDGVTDVTEVRQGIERVTPASDGRSPMVREAYARETAGPARTTAEVREQLEGLGYL